MYAESILDLRRHTRNAVSEHISSMLDMANSQEDAMSIHALMPKSMIVERACVKDWIMHHDWSAVTAKSEITTDLDTLIAEYEESLSFPLHTVPETVPVSNRPYVVISEGRASPVVMGMFSTLENAQTALLCGKDGDWTIYEEYNGMDGHSQRHAIILFYENSEPFLLGVYDQSSANRASEMTTGENKIFLSMK